jgi:hypothetical protein
MNSAPPIMPEDRRRADRHWMQQDAHLAGLRRRPAIPLTLLAQWTGTATADTGPIHDAQAAIGFSASLMGGKRLVGGTAQRAIRLEREIRASETARFEGDGNRRLAIPTGGGLLLVGFGHRQSELGGTYWIRMKLMPQFQAEIPDPLRDHLPALLPPGGVATPPIGILLGVFIC